MLGKIQTNKEEGRTGRFLCPLSVFFGLERKQVLSFCSLSYSSIAMEKDEPSSLQCPDTHCALCGHRFRGKKDRRVLSDRDGVLYISGQVSLLGDSIFMEPKFACQKCFGDNSSLVWVPLSVLTLAHSLCLLPLPFIFILCIIFYLGYLHAFADAYCCIENGPRTFRRTKGIARAPCALPEAA